jgi:hypothetical protein
MKFLRMQQMWRRGWSMVGKTFLAYVIVSLLQLPWLVLGAIPAVVEFFRTDSSSSITVRLLLAALLILVYLPLSFYIAASAVGFCSPITASRSKSTNDT